MTHMTRAATAVLVLLAARGSASAQPSAAGGPRREGPGRPGPTGSPSPGAPRGRSPRRRGWGLVTGGARGDGIDGHLIAAAFASPGETAQVPVVLEIPGASLLLGDKGEKTGVQIYAYANDADGTLADYVATEMTLDLAKTRQSLASGGLKFYGTLYLPSGNYDVRALVRNATTGRSGVFTARVTVPGIPGGAPTVLPPFFAEPAGRWVMVRAQPRADAPPREADYPFAVAGEAFIPGALPAVANGSETRIAVVTYNFSGGARPAPLQLRAQSSDRTAGRDPWSYRSPGNQMRNGAGAASSCSRSSRRASPPGATR